MTSENKPQLKMKRPDYVGEVDAFDLNHFIQEAYDLKRPFEVVANEEWNNDSSYVVYAEKKKLGPWDEKKISSVKEGLSPSFSIRAIFNDLCNKGLLEPGKYLIWVSW